MIEFVRNRNLFDYDASVRVNAVNCVGVMGAGIALEFKKRYPAMFESYRRACLNHEVLPGRLHVWESRGGGPSGEPLSIVNVPTKRHWRWRSTIQDVESGLVALRQYIAARRDEPGAGHFRVTMPALGCGLGGLAWGSVRGLIERHLAEFDGDDQPTIYVFQPREVT